LKRRLSIFSALILDSSVDDGTRPNLKKINEYVDRSLMLVTALAPVIGYDKVAKIAHHARDNDLTLKAAALQLGFVTEANSIGSSIPKRW
jgi:fumarate hydratase class II